MTKLERIVEELKFDYEFIGIRIQEENFEVGKVTHNSRIWIDGDETEEELDGICAVKVDKTNVEKRFAKANNLYFGEHVAIIVSNDAEWGEDEHEIIMKNAEVAYIIK